MEFKVIISEEATDDLQRIVSFIAIDNPDAASNFGRKLIAAVRPLGRHHRIGRVVPEFNDQQIRELIFGNYRIPYRISEGTGTIEILRYWHAARGIPTIR